MKNKYLVCINYIDSDVDIWIDSRGRYNVYIEEIKAKKIDVLKYWTFISLESLIKFLNELEDFGLKIPLEKIKENEEI